MDRRESRPEIHNEKKGHRRHAAPRHTAHAARPRGDGDYPYKHTRFHGQTGDDERHGGRDISPHTSARLREIEDQQTADDAFQIQVDRKRFTNEPAKGVESGEDRKGEDCRRDIGPRPDPQSPGKQKQSRRDQQRMKTTEDQPVVTGRHIEQHLGLHLLERPEKRVPWASGPRRSRHSEGDCWTSSSSCRLSDTWIGFRIRSCANESATMAAIR